MLLNGVSIRKMKEGYSKPRNRAIAYAFVYMKIIEKWGSRLKKIGLIPMIPNMIPMIPFPKMIPKS